MKRRWLIAGALALGTLSPAASGQTHFDASGTVIPAVAASASNPTSKLTLPASTTPYSAGQLIANSATASSVSAPSFAIPAPGSAIIPRLRLSTNDATSTAWGNASIQV